MTDERPTPGSICERWGNKYLEAGDVHHAASQFVRAAMCFETDSLFARAAACWLKAAAAANARAEVCARREDSLEGG